MLFKNITILDENLEMREDVCVQVIADRITYIGKDMPRQNAPAKRDMAACPNTPAPQDDIVYDGKGKLLMSGFFNAHAHSPMTLMRGYGENLALQDWLTKKIFPFEDKLDGNAVYWGTMLAMAESLRYGIVSTSDMYYICDDMARAFIKSGAKGNIARSIANPTGTPPEKLKSLAEAKAFYENFHGEANGRIKVDMCLHAEYTSDRKTAVALAEYAESIDTIMQVHVSETKLEHEECRQRHGVSPSAYLEETGLFDVPAIAAHCVYADDNDLEILRRKGVTVATNPVSNMKLASGICDAARILAKGINLAIGTDSVASNNSLEFVEEIKMMAIGNKVAVSDPTAITPQQALRAATFGGAKAQGRVDSGVLAVGKKADLIVFDISLPNMHPVHSLINNLVYSGSGSDVIMTMVDGKVLYDNGDYRTIDIEKTIYETERATKKILERL